MPAPQRTHRQKSYTSRSRRFAFKTGGGSVLSVSALVAQETKCRYPSKCCDNLRAVKSDGELHKFCEFHRAKANRNQRKHEHKRRLLKYDAIAKAKQLQVQAAASKSASMQATDATKDKQLPPSAKSFAGSELSTPPQGASSPCSPSLSSSTTFCTGSPSSCDLQTNDFWVDAEQGNSDVLDWIALEPCDDLSFLDEYQAFGACAWEGQELSSALCIDDLGGYMEDLLG